MTLCECKCGQETKSKNRFILGHNSRINNPAKNSKSTRKMLESRNMEIFPIPTLCRCGCNEIVYNANEWIRGHSGRLNKGKLLGENNPSKRPEVRIKISNKLGGKNHYLYGKHLTMPHKNSVSIGIQNSEKFYESARSEIKRKKLSLTKMGNKNPNWNGGTSRLPYPLEFNEGIKEDIALRDNYTCQKCSKIEKEENGRKLSIHHIDYNKDNCNFFNLIVLCHTCNIRANFNRQSWTEYFTDLINEKFSLKRHFEGDIQ